MEVVAPLNHRAAQATWTKHELPKNGSLKVRSVFLSDVHLGFPGCSAGFLCDFLDTIACDYLYLVGDIVDFRYLSKRRFWSESHSDVVHKILELARTGTRTVYIPGNHDESVRRFDGLVFGRIEVRAETIHESADGRRFLILHGDQFDGAVRCSPLLALIGTKMYHLLLKSNTWLNWVRQRCGKDYWSLAIFLKQRVKNAVKYIERYEDAAFKAARTNTVDAIICGHIHRAEIINSGSLTYMNCGDWVESCTALVEHPDGRMELLQWRERVKSLKALRVPGPSPLVEDRAA